MFKLYPAALLLLTVTLTFGLGSCQKENTSIPSSLQNKSLTGKWYLRTLTQQTSIDTSLTVKSEQIGSFTSDDYFEFKDNNAAVYSSTIIGKRYEGYYSAISAATPPTLTFKSNDYVEKYNVSKISKDSLVIYQTQSTKNNAITTTVADYYIYTH